MTLEIHFHTQLFYTFPPLYAVDIPKEIPFRINLHMKAWSTTQETSFNTFLDAYKVAANRYRKTHPDWEDLVFIPIYNEIVA